MVKASWKGHEFEVYATGADWNNVPGVYIFCGINAQNRWEALYIGQAQSFRDRFSSHEQWDPAARLGATHVHARVIRGENEREAVEFELIQACQPRLNTQLR
ncbi:MAG: hypothetical protein HKL90_14805 [Elusimicrobia bacterium]|nr:hypothetical protein [Elusimicrobiota bacterium]